MTTEDPGVKLRVHLWNSVPVQLGLGVLVITWAALALGFLLLENKQTRQFTEQYVGVAKKEGLIIASDLAQRMLAGGRKQVWNAISSEAAQHRDIIGAANIRVLNGEGTVVAASDRAAIGTRIEVRDNPDCPRCDSTRRDDFPAVATVTTPDGARSLRVVNAVPFSQDCMECHEPEDPPHGLISIDYDMAPLERAAAQRRHDIVVTALVAGVLVMALTALLFRRLVMRSVYLIARSAHRLAAGNLAARARVVGKNELSLLARDFNHMAARIEEQVTHIEAAHNESELLYTLVVEASKNLENSEIATAVTRVLAEKLRPRQVAFFLETADGGWSCAAGGTAMQDRTASGEGVLEEVLSADAAQSRALPAGMPSQIVADACRSHKLQVARSAGGFTFSLPVVADTRLLGLLVCADIPAAIQVRDNLIENLGVHLTLAAINSRNYTGAVTDALTRLKNKRYGMIRLEEAVYAARRYKSDLGLLMCDIDHFKQVNDSRGHPAGDAVLKEVAHRIAACVRKTDVAVRYGGEEFMLILPETNANLLAMIGEKLRLAVAAAPIGLGAAGASVALTMSVGCAAFRADMDSGETLIARADAALYRAKTGGRNRVEYDGR